MLVHLYIYLIFSSAKYFTSVLRVRGNINLEYVRHYTTLTAAPNCKENMNRQSNIIKMKELMTMNQSFCLFVYLFIYKYKLLSVLYTISIACVYVKKNIKFNLISD
jgi:hypothetical protein